jgi:hypothetical protein
MENGNVSSRVGAYISATHDGPAEVILRIRIRA